MLDTYQDDSPPSSTTVVEKVADRKGVAIEGLDPLHESIDIDLVDAVLQSGQRESESTFHLQFQYEDCTIIAYSGGLIEIEEHSSQLLN